MGDGLSVPFIVSCQKSIISLIVTQSRENITSIMSKGLVTKDDIDRLKWQRPFTKGK